MKVISPDDGDGLQHSPAEQFCVATPPLLVVQWSPMSFHTAVHSKQPTNGERGRGPVERLPESALDRPCQTGRNSARLGSSYLRQEETRRG